MNLRPTINVAIFGCVSVGKSTFLNMLMNDMFSDCHIKRTTTMPQIYHELSKSEARSLDEKKDDNYDRTLSDLRAIRETNSRINKESMDKTAESGVSIKLDEIKPLVYVVPPIKDFIKTVSDEKGNNVTLNIFDMPGLNDSISKDVYFEYVKNTFNQYDIVIFVMDINSALNTSDDNDILDLILEGIISNKEKHIDTQLLSVLNKCDELEFSKPGPLRPEDPERQEMVEQAKNILTLKITEKELDMNINITCISSENAFIYRMCKANKIDELGIRYINKIGQLECAQRVWKQLKTEKEKRKKVTEFLKKDEFKNEGLRLSGFREFSKRFTELMTPDLQYKLVFNRVNDYLKTEARSGGKLDISDDLMWFRQTKVAIHNINRIFSKELNSNFDMYASELSKFLDQHHTFIKTQTLEINAIQGLKELMIKWSKKGLLFIKKHGTNATLFIDYCTEQIRSKGVDVLSDKTKTVEELMTAITILITNSIDAKKEILDMMMNINSYNSKDQYLGIYEFIMTIPEKTGITTHDRKKALVFVMDYIMTDLIKNSCMATTSGWQYMYMDIVRLLHTYTVDPFDPFWFLIEKIKNFSIIWNTPTVKLTIIEEIMVSTELSDVPTTGYMDRYKFVKLTMDLIYGEQ